MRGSIVVLALVVSSFVPRLASGQGNSQAAQCKERQRGNPSQSGLDHRADPTTKGNKDCTPPAPPPPPVVYGHTSVSGSVFYDLNQDGVFDPVNEVGLSGWTVQISGPMSQTAITDGNGAYSFTGLTPGNYTVCVVPPAGWNPISPSSGPSCATGFGYSVVAPQLVGDVAYTGYDFGWVSQ